MEQKRKGWAHLNNKGKEWKELTEEELLERIPKVESEEGILGKA